MKVLSLNCRNWTRDKDEKSQYYWRKRARAINRMVHTISPDVICFQEMLFPMTDYVPSGYKRVGVSISHHIYIRKSMKATDIKFHIHWQSCKVDGITIFCVHGHWDTDKTDALCKDLLANCGTKAIAVGDFNVGIDALVSRGLPLSARQMMNLEPVDTFANFTKPESHGEIDHAFLWGLTPIKYQVHSYAYGAGRLSDHYPIICDF